MYVVYCFSSNLSTTRPTVAPPSIHALWFIPLISQYDRGIKMTILILLPKKIFGHFVVKCQLKTECISSRLDEKHGRNYIGLEAFSDQS